LTISPYHHGLSWGLSLTFQNNFNNLTWDFLFKGVWKSILHNKWSWCIYNRPCFWCLTRNILMNVFSWRWFRNVSQLMLCWYVTNQSFEFCIAHSKIDQKMLQGRPFTENLLLNISIPAFNKYLLRTCLFHMYVMLRWARQKYIVAKDSGKSLSWVGLLQQ
jgi:hypothetical protein